MTDQAVYLFVRWQVKPGKISSVLETLSQVAAKSKSEEGNLLYNIHQSQSDENTLLLYEGYRNPAALEAHRSSEHFVTLVLGKIVPDLLVREVTMASLLF